MIERFANRIGLPFLIVCPLLAGCAAMDDESDTGVYGGVSQALTVTCEGEGDFGRVRYAAMQVSYNDRPEVLAFAVAPRNNGDLVCVRQNGPDALPNTPDDTFVGPTINFGPVTGILAGDALISVGFFGVGPCDDPDANPATEDGREYTVLRPQVIECDTTTPRPTCTFETEVVNCVEL